MNGLIAIVLCAPSRFVQAPKSVALFDGRSLSGWHMDVPDLDEKPDLSKPFVVRPMATGADTLGGKFVLVSLGSPMGHLITDASFEDYRLEVDYRFTKVAGNSGLIVHVSKPRLLRNLLPQGIEVQLRSGDAGDFHLFGETLMKADSPADKAGKNLTDNSERPIGQWNTIIVECRGDAIKVWVNGTMVNHGIKSSVSKGRIALQSEGTEVEFRKIELNPL